MTDLSKLLIDSPYNPIIDLNNKQPRFGPRYAEIHLTNLCNSHCYFCNQISLRENKGSFDYDFLINTISTLKGNGLKAIRLSGGGEPTVYPKIHQIIEFIGKNTISLSRFDTNGIDLSCTISKQLIECKLKVLHISLQAPNSFQWARITQKNPKAFDKILYNISTFIELDTNRSTKVYASFILDENTSKSIPEMYDLCQKLGLGINIHYLNCHTYKKDYKKNVMPDVDKLLREYQPESNGDDKNIVCGAPWAAILVKPNGDVYPCCALQDKKFIMGNIYYADPLSIWNCPKYNDFRRAFLGINTSGVIFRLPDSCDNNCPVMKGMMSISKNHLLMIGNNNS